MLAGLAGTTAYAAATASPPHTGSIPSVGPASAGGGGMGGMGGTDRGYRRCRPDDRHRGHRPRRPARHAPAPHPTGTHHRHCGRTGTAATGGPVQVLAPAAAQGSVATSSSALDALLAKSTARWAAATIGDQSRGDLELSSGASVMAIGGWSGTDQSPTLAQFEAYVKAGDITYFIAGGGMGGGGGARNGGGAAAAASRARSPPG